MTTYKKLSFVLAFLISTGAYVGGNAYAGQPETVAKSYYVSALQLPPETLAPPPLADSTTDAADLAEVMDWQHKRTKTECEGAEKTAKEFYNYMLETPNLFPKPMPEQAKVFFERITSDLEPFVDAAKKHYRRLRPFKAHSTVHPCIDKAGGFAYPSGHSTYAWVFAGVLGDISPGRKDEFIRLANRVAQDRVIGGVHYPSDVAAGKVLGDKFYAELLKSAKYLDDVKKVKSLLLKLKREK